MEIEVASVSELREKGRKLVMKDDKRVVLFFLGGIIHAIDAVCPHRGGPLEEGEVADGEVVCPWHGFTYELVNGDCSTNPTYKIHAYKVRLDGEKVFLNLE